MGELKKSPFMIRHLAPTFYLNRMLERGKLLDKLTGERYNRGSIVGRVALKWEIFENIKGGLKCLKKAGLKKRNLNLRKLI